MKSKRKKIIKTIITTLIIVFLMGVSVSFGVGYSKQITAWFYNIQVKLNGNYLIFSKEPFIYEGTVYIPLRDVSQNLGLEVTWDGDTHTVNLASTSKYNDVYGTTPSYYNNSSSIITSGNKSMQDIEDELNENYEEYTYGYKDLEFTYELSNLNSYSSYTKVKMEGENFKRDSKYWDDRDESDFQDFIEDIAELVANELDDDVNIYVYDENSKNVGKYKYDESKRDFEVVSEYGEDGDIDDLEDDLNDDYDTYEDDNEDLEFEYSLTEKSSYIKVEMEGDFDRDDDDWRDRDEDDFQDFIEDIIDEICDEFDDMDIKIYVTDEDNDETAEYIYDEDDDDLDIDEYDDDDLDAIEDDLNDDYDKYYDDNEDLEFEYSLTEKSSYIKVEMEGDFDRNDSAWKDRDENDFQDFIEDIVDEICDEIDDMNIRIYISDEDNDETAEYIYDEDDEDIDDKYEY